MSDPNGWVMPDYNDVLGYSDIYIPPDIQEYGQRHKIPEFANATYRAGYIDGFRAAQKAFLEKPQPWLRTLEAGLSAVAMPETDPEYWSRRQALKDKKVDIE